MTSPSGQGGSKVTPRFVTGKRQYCGLPILRETSPPFAVAVPLTKSRARVALNQATQHWDTMLEQPVRHLPPDAGEGWNGGRAQAACSQPLHPHPSPPPSQGEGSLCANLMGSDLGGSVMIIPNPSM